MQTLDQIKTGYRARVVSYKEPIIASRLMAMGIIPGTELMVLRKSLMSSTYFIQFPKLALALRRDEAALIVIESEI
ncbi:MAG: ferrous iron transport protein A [Chitinophagales bacterium]|nr:ferrous iron transport protein A [Chitinophagales bacterium]MCZ2394369.1 ferrous iron transport protein A [Chitinophagales bacterium]